MSGLFDGYRGIGFCEVFDADGVVRPHYQALVSRLEELTPEEITQRTDLLASIFRTKGITFAVSGEAEGIERTWPMDLVPRIIPAAEWSGIEQGLIQRVSALNYFLDDIYAGERAIIRDRKIPRWLINSSPGYLPEAVGIEIPHQARCVVSGIDLVRDGEGTYRILEDNLRVPSGVSYVIENRAAMASNSATYSSSNNNSDLGDPEEGPGFQLDPNAVLPVDILTA